MLDWAEAHYREKPSEQPLTIEAAEFEPVGTVPSFQKRGLGSALLAYAHNRLREMRCPLATVQSWSLSDCANKLYQAAGLLPKDHQLNWVKA